MATYCINRVLDHILLLEKYSYKVIASLKKQVNGRYLLKLEFSELSEPEYNELKYLGKFRQAVPIRSELLSNEYGIHAVVVIAHEKISDSALLWRCHWYPSLFVL